MSYSISHIFWHYHHHWRHGRDDIAISMHDYCDTVCLCCGDIQFISGGIDRDTKMSPLAMEKSVWDNEQLIMYL
jgi:hypothetical protein